MSFDLNKCKRDENGYWLCRTLDGRDAKVVANLGGDYVRPIVALVGAYTYQCYPSGLLISGTKDAFDLLNYPEPAIAEGHNPDKLTVEQVGVSEGWRLLAVEEYNRERSITSFIQQWSKGGVAWDDSGWSAADIGATYRTQKHAGYYLPKPKEYREWTMDEVPMDAQFKKTDSGWSYFIKAINYDQSRVLFGNGSYDMLDLRHDVLHSIDNGKTWHKCEVEV